MVAAAAEHVLEELELRRDAERPGEEEEDEAERGVHVAGVWFAAVALGLAVGGVLSRTQLSGLFGFGDASARARARVLPPPAVIASAKSQSAVDFFRAPLPSHPPARFLPARLRDSFWSFDELATSSDSGQPTHNAARTLPHSYLVRFQHRMYAFVSAHHKLGPSSTDNFFFRAACI